jgi:hypothetical protein
MTLKYDDQSSQKWPAKVRSSTTSLHKNGFGLEKIQHKPALNLLSWPQEGLVYIDLKLVTISQLSPKIWPQKGPNIPQKGPKISKTAQSWAKTRQKPTVVTKNQNYPQGPGRTLQNRVIWQ